MMRDLKRNLKLDVDIQTLRSMREQGMTNKQIANNLGVSVSTVYRYIGRKSQQVKYDEIQNKPCPVPNPTGFVELPKPEKKEPEVYIPESTEPKKNVELRHDIPAEETIVHCETPRNSGKYPDSSPLLRMISSRFKLQGSLCNYEVDTDSGTIEMQEGIITGLLDKDTVRRFLSELNEVADMLDKMKL